MTKGLNVIENVRTRQVVMPIENNNIFGEYIIKGYELIDIEKELMVLDVIKECEIIYAEYGNNNYIVVPKNKMDLLKKVLL